MKLALKNPDAIGAVVSILCLMHCAATPLIFLAHACALDNCQSAPAWWRNFDYLFLTLSFFSVHHATLTTGKPLMKPLLWTNWCFLFACIANERIALFTLPETITHITALTLAGSHLYNLKYCQCKNDNCCTKNG